MSGGIFISYRRDDASFLAGRLYGRLLQHFPQDKIFMDLDRMAHGEDLVKTIEKAIESTDLLIAVIGKQWAISDLENLDDHVHLELAAAFKRKIRVIPILVEGASMPRYDELPDDLKALALLNAWQISNANFDADCTHLFSAILGAKSRPPSRPGMPDLPEATMPPAAPMAEPPPLPRPRKRPAVKRVPPRLNGPMRLKGPPVPNDDLNYSAEPIIFGPKMPVILSG